jgi:hypothetical protein
MGMGMGMGMGIIIFIFFNKFKYKESKKLVDSLLWIVRTQLAHLE